MRRARPAHQHRGRWRGRRARGGLATFLWPSRAERAIFEWMRARSLRSRFLPAAAAAALVLAAGAGLRAENFVRVGYGEGSPGEAGVQVVVLGMNDVPIHGYSLALAYPRDVLSLRSFSVGKSVMKPTPERPASKPAQSDSTSFPNGLTAPSPVTTTRRRMVMPR